MSARPRGRSGMRRSPPQPPPLHRKAALSLGLALLGLPFFLFLPSGPAWRFLVPVLEVCSVAAVILGVVSVREIKRTADAPRNRRMAVAGTAFGCIGAAGFTLILVLLVLPGPGHAG